MASFQIAADDDYSVDPSEPFKGIVVCCTSIPPEHRSELDAKVKELGGIHKYDLTPDVTHLVVGEYDTPKYRHVARDRPDVKAMDASWIEAVSEIWKNDDEIDLRKLENAHRLRPLETSGVKPSSDAEPATRGSLLVCLTGFVEKGRDAIAERITSNGGRYTADLTRKCTHLIVSKPAGKKFNAAKMWDIHTVTLTWLEQTIERGMILDESCYNPLAPAEEQGVGAWNKKDPRRASLGKRSRSMASSNTDDGTRKLRKTASMKLHSQKNNLWSDILGRPESTTTPNSDSGSNQGSLEAAPGKVFQQHQQEQSHGIFSQCAFVIEGFVDTRAQLIDQTVRSLGGDVLPSVSACAICTLPHRFLIVPQASQPETHPHVPSDTMQVVTEFFLERCLHNKRFFHPSEHVLGRPFPLFPVPGFADLRICTAAFTGIDLIQVSRSVVQLGAVYEETFDRGVSVLVCRSLEGTRKEKLKLAIEWGVPVVPADWLWECINTGYGIPIEKFIYAEFRGRYRQSLPASSESASVRPRIANQLAVRTHSDPFPRKSRPAAGPQPKTGIDTSGFEQDPEVKSTKAAHSFHQHDSTTSADFMTAPSRQLAETHGRNADAPLAELSSASLNKSPSPTKPSVSPRRSKSEAPEKPTSGAPSTAKSGVEEAELARKEARAAERQVLSSKLTTLLQPTATGDVGGTASPNEDPSSAAEPIPRPRKRQIMGRALSNTSSVADSFRAGGGEAQQPQQPQAEDEDAEPEGPPSTQLEYRDPQAQEYRAAVMSRMESGGSGDVKLSVGTTGHGHGTQTVGVVAGRSLRKR